MCLSTPESLRAGRQTPQSRTSSPGSGCWWCRADWLQPPAKEKCFRKVKMNHFSQLLFITLRTQFPGIYTRLWWWCCAYSNGSSVGFLTKFRDISNTDWISCSTSGLGMVDILISIYQGFTSKKCLNFLKLMFITSEICNTPKSVRESRTELFGVKEKHSITWQWQYNQNYTVVPLRDRGPTVHLQKTCTGALLLAGPGSLQSHYGFVEKKRKSISAILVAQVS